MKKKSSSVIKITHKKFKAYLTDKRINKIYLDFKKNLKLLETEDINKFAIALSGGPDSLALAYYAKLYSLENNTKINFYHVNHNLRENSYEEAKYIQKKLINFNIKIKVLKWMGIKPKSNIQAIARKARYKLIINQLKKDKIKTIIFGHNKNDLFENFIMRILRGSGLNGFVSFNSKLIKNDGYNLLRPFLNVKKDELTYVAQKVYKFYLKDPSNNNFFFKRSRVRNLLKNLEYEGLDIEKINLTIKNLTSSNRSIEYYSQQNIENNAIFLKNVNSYMLNQNFFNQPKEIVFRSFSKIIKLISNKYYLPRGKKIERLIIDLKNRKRPRFTLSDCLIEKICNSVLISQENSKKKIKSV